MLGGHLKNTENGGKAPALINNVSECACVSCEMFCDRYKHRIVY